jgi:pilus assembly protein CpaF
MMELLSSAVKARISIVISGGTGSGKTTLLNILSQYIPNNERLVTIEDAAELRLAQENIVRLETRPPNIEGNGAIKQRQLLINCLRMRPDRIIMGEIRGEEAFDMLQAMNTGHEGSMTTIHANTPRDAISRLESMVAMGNMNLPEKSVRQQISSAISIVVQATRMSDGSRKVTSIAEITGMEENVISMQEIFTFNKKGIGPDGKVIGAFQPTRIRPKFLDRLRVSGIILPPSLFEKETPVNYYRKEFNRYVGDHSSRIHGRIRGSRFADVRQRLGRRAKGQAGAGHAGLRARHREPGDARSDREFAQE